MREKTDQCRRDQDNFASQVHLEKTLTYSQELIILAQVYTNPRSKFSGASFPVQMPLLPFLYLLNIMFPLNSKKKISIPL